MSKKYIVVGGVAGGASVAARLRRIDEHVPIQIYDKGYDVSFSNCCLPNYFSGEVAAIDDLIFYDAASLKQTYNLDVKVRHEVISILPDQHKVVVKNLETGEEFEDGYDALILSPGAKAILPRSIKGIDSSHVFSLKNVSDVRAIAHHLTVEAAEELVVVGGGFIGVEMAECLKKAGKTVHLVEASPQIMTPFDEDMVQMLHKELLDNGVNLILEDAVEEITGDSVRLSSGKILPAQAVIMAIGVTPDVEFAVASGIQLGETGAIAVDATYQTNLPDVYAIGDAIEVTHRQTGKKIRLPLAGPAQKQARNLADALSGKPQPNRGVIGSSCIRVFALNAAATGLNEKSCQAQGIDYRVALVIPNDRVGLMPEASPMHFKLIYEYPTGKVLGAQAISKGNPVKNINVIATVISMGGYLEDLKELELCYAPAFSTAKDVVNFAGIVGLNYLHGVYEQVPVTSVRSLVQNGEYILDVRGKDAFEAAHIKGAVNIPLDEIRDRLDEIPKDRHVYIHCRTSWNSYYAICALKGYGYDNIINIQGSFLMLSYYEYFKDQTTGREPIVTGYNFD
ncbi:FAD-dependent oxidoreductase [Streptococcus acidominimus]|uniref:Pyridine nucleotide-disulfide oxidoreductase n=1 Tax=Streptococcus acidominimus TaxID=1326 RepID=A0A1Q8EG44_STRAI|nr:FAD-dependent oxidoreductase [Streptococcus acidominimus]OLF50785.1 pyridine nucleotide-disulfide oxidoreductase [Streptococcus acidominimus]SUN07903.1 pyridine nucleotide-disulfide oxidoreductase [Streptococcus acidominimus]